MKVKELIEQLKKIDPKGEMAVVFQDTSEEFYDPVPRKGIGYLDRDKKTCNPFLSSRKQDEFEVIVL